MIKVAKEGVGWSVKRDGVLLTEEHRTGLHVTKETAVRHAEKVAADTHEEIQVEESDKDDVETAG